MKKMFYNLSGGDPKMLYTACAASILDGIVKIIPAALVFDIFNTIYQYFADPAVPLNMTRLWTVCGLLFLLFAVQLFTYSFAYDKTYLAAYTVSASGRISLAEHLRRLSLGFLGSRDPGDLTTMMLGDYANVETSISHYVPQIVTAIVLPVVAFVSLFLSAGKWHSQCLPPFRSVF
nr:ABC transporter transmembrane domain-containing protein [Brucepastera parasyntrophica]